MDNTNPPKPKKKGFWALLKESMTKSSEGCGPECGCHAAPPAKGTEAAKDDKPKGDAAK